MPPVSRRARRIPASPIRKLVPLAEAAAARGVHVHHLNIGQPDLPTPEVMLEALKEITDTTIAYQPSRGRAECLEFLRSYYGRHGVELTHEQLLVTTGASEALHFALAAVTSAGDEVLAPEPLYANYVGFCEMLGARLKPVPTKASNGWALPPDLPLRVGPETRAILLCNPSNPTGAVYREPELRALLEVARERDVFVIIDEVYREFAFDGDPPPSLLSMDEDDRVIVIDSFSKRYSMCGARLGSLATRNVEVMDCAMRLAQARLSTPLIAQLMGAKAALLDEGYDDELRETYRVRVDTVCDALERIPGISFTRPNGAFYCWAELPVDDSERFVRFMLEQFELDGETTMVAPGSGFFVTPEQGSKAVRIACVLAPHKLQRAMTVFEAGLAAYQKCGREGQARREAS
jgi:aspartate aminotransferase